MKKLITGILLGLLLVKTSIAQVQPELDWCVGQLKLIDGTQLDGQINYNWKAEIVQFQQDGRIRAYSAQQVSGFSFFNPNDNTLRHFRVVAFPVRPSLIRPLFMEEIIRGELTVYRRLHHGRELFKTARPTGFNASHSCFNDPDRFDYYVVKPNAEPTAFTSVNDFFSHRWSGMNAAFEQELRRFTQALQLNTTKIQTRLMLIARYNALVVTRPSES
jgi:hypothetical protein